MTTPKDVMKLIKENDVKYADLRFTDPRGKWQHVTMDITTIDEDTFSEGLMFDGSSIAGWKAIHESDMQLMPDPESACIDPFYAETTIVLVCDTLDREKGRRAGQVHGRGRHRVLRAGSRVLHLRRREIRGNALQHRFQTRLR